MPDPAAPPPAAPRPPRKRLRTIEKFRRTRLHLDRIISWFFFLFALLGSLALVAALVYMLSNLHRW